jgi:hypothetical protein
MSVDDVVSRLCSEISIGMARAQVEQVLAALPVTKDYQARPFLESIGEATTDGQALSGRYVVQTRPEFPVWDFFLKRQAFFSILFDEKERVLKVRVETFRIPVPICPHVDSKGREHT